MKILVNRIVLVTAVEVKNPNADEAPQERVPSLRLFVLLGNILLLQRQVGNDVCFRVASLLVSIPTG